MEALQKKKLPAADLQKDAQKTFPNEVPEASGGSFLSSQRIIFELAGALLDALGALGALWGGSGGLPGTLRGRSGSSREALGTLRGHPWDN